MQKRPRDCDGLALETLIRDLITEELRAVQTWMECTDGNIQSLKGKMIMTQAELHEVKGRLHRHIEEVK